MPEYLAPGVYVEEIDTGSKPIEGASTSTAGMLGVTERGPVNVPILITSYGEYTRWFGERLNALDFQDHCYLPHAVAGFFTNGGKRIYITRVLDSTLAARATAVLFNRGGAATADTVLLRAARELTGTVANPPLVIALDSGTLAASHWVRIGDGSATEYRQVDVAPVPNNTLIPLNFPYNRSHASGQTIHEMARVSVGGGFTLVGDVARGATTAVVDGANADITALAAGTLLELGGVNGEYRFLAAAPVGVVPVSGTNSQATIQLDSPLAMAYTDGAAAQRIELPPTNAFIDDTQVDTDYIAGDRILFKTDTAASFNIPTNLVIINSGNLADQEARRIGALHLFTLSTGAYEGYPGGSLVEEVTLTDDQRALDGAPLANNPTITLDSVADLVVGQTLLVGVAGPDRETAVIRMVDPAANQVTLNSALVNLHNDGDPVVPAPKALTAAASAGAGFLALNNRMGLMPGDVLRIGAAAPEFLTIVSTPGRIGVGTAPDAGNVVVTPALGHSYPSGTEVVRQFEPTLGAQQPTVTVLDSHAGDLTLLVSDGLGYASGDMLRLTTLNGAIFYHQLAANPTTPSPNSITLQDAISGTHPLGSALVGRDPILDPLLRIEALDPGIWGDRLRISVQDEPAGLVSRTTLTFVGLPTQIQLASSAGVEPGAILELLDPTTNMPVGGLLKVSMFNRTTGEITLQGAGLDAGQQAAHAAASGAGTRLGVRSREFNVTVRLLRQPDPIMPSRNETVIDLETFRYLSMDSRHSRYIHKVIGTTWSLGNTEDDDDRPLRLSDRRSEGESRYIRVRDTAQDLGEPDRTTALESIRLGPETLVDVLPTGQIRPARHPLSDGNDSIATLTDTHYIGQDDPTPENRTGLHSLRNIEEISIVAVPGRISAQMQGELIAHCELMRYRFAVLDGPRPPADELADVQIQRQQFDTKYAALYHPWLLIPDPFPTNVVQSPAYPIPPSGHLLGIYARTDIERGVHKAPANEVVRGVIGLQRLLNKEQHDILNPYPVNINVIRDFRPNNRGIRVFGGRVITSDTDWKYVNVRRLMIFIEASIDRSLQWVVFEPNAEPLWARVRRTISNFLTVVWRNGALEGTKPEAAYFVKCDRTTMTQTDIDNGRLICVIGVAPVKPAEFVIIRIGLWTAHAED